MMIEVMMTTGIVASIASTYRSMSVFHGPARGYVRSIRCRYSSANLERPWEDFFDKRLQHIADVIAGDCMRPHHHQ
jgi:hypothetical protein